MERIVTVYRSQMRSACEERALVLTAIGIDAEVVHDAGGCGLIVDAGDAPRAIDELARYDTENRGWRRPRRDPLPKRSSGWPGVLVYVGALLWFAICQNQDLFGFDWLDAGRIDGGLIRDGEWWRVLTALTLHVDTGHLLGNIGFGAAFGYFAGQLLGSGLAWSSILIAGGLGNLLNVLVQSDAHRAVGASTAVFAALGIVAAYAWVHRRGSGDRWAYRWAPLVAGAILLTWFGTGDENTDIVAHLTGFVCGLALGALFGTKLHALVEARRPQVIAAAAGAGMVIAAWCIALA
ncbi:MAG: rhomboid family intramembrane serine protease [Gammaproteobacteria bacterium]